MATLLGLLPVASGQISFSETFTGTTAPGWVFGAAPGDTLPALTANTIDSPGNGWLRLNTNTGNQSTSALYDTQVFSVNAKIEIEMDYASWNGTGADGITFFLVDGDTTAGTFTPGAYGGSMGYANRTGGSVEGGMAGGYLGFALDDWGNYSNNNEGRNGGVAGPGPGIDTTLRPNTIAVRGPDTGGVGGQDGFDFIAASADLATLSGGGQMDFPTYTTRPVQTGADYRGFKITLDANNQLLVEMKFGATSSYITAFTADLSAYERPDTFKIGFTGATGGSTEFHEIRNLTLITTPWSTGSGAYEWDNGAGTTTWGTTAGGEANTNWYSSVTGDDNKTPLRDADVLFGDKPTVNPNNTQQVTLGNNVEVRNLTFDTAIDYSIGTVGDGKKITFGDTTLVGLPSINVNYYNGSNGHQKINTDIDVTENLAIRNFSYSTLCLNGTYDTNSNTTTVSGFGAVNFNGDIVGGGALVKNGSGITTINNNNSDGATPWTGATLINEGMLVVTADGALGSGTPTGSLALTSGSNLATLTSLADTIGTGQAVTGTGIPAGTTVTQAVQAGTRDFTRVTGSNTITVTSGTGGSTGLIIGQIVTGTGIPAGTRITNISGNTLTLSANATSTGTNVGGGFSALLVLSQNATATGTNTGTFVGNTTVASGATLAFRGGVTSTTTEAVTINGYGIQRGSGEFAGAIHNDGSNNSFSGTVTLGSNSAIGSRDGVLTLSGVISDGSSTFNLSKLGDGVVNLSNTSNSWNGSTTIGGGALRIGTGENALAGGFSTNGYTGGNLILAGGVLESNVGTTFTRQLGTGSDQIQWTGDGGFSAYGAGRTVTLTNSAGTAGGTLTWNAGSFVPTGNALLLSSDYSDNTITLTNAIDLGGAQRQVRVANGSAAVDGILSGNLTNGGLIKTGEGTLTLSGTNTYTGATEIKDGALRGTVSTSSNIQLNGGVYEISANFNAASNLGTGAGQVQWTGGGGFSAHTNNATVSLNSGATMTWASTSGFVASGNTLTLGSVSADKTLTLSNAINLNAGARTIEVVAGTAAGIANATLTGVLSNGDLTVIGNGRLDSTATNTLAGTLTVKGAEFRLSGANGTAGSLTGITLQEGGTLTLDSTGSLNQTRIGNSAPVSLNGGSIFQRGNNNNNTRESLGALTLSGGANTIDILNSGTGDARLSFTTLTRSAGATLDVVRPNGNSDLQFRTTAPTLDDSILAYATVGSADFATVAAINTDVTAYTGYTTTGETNWNVTTVNAAPAADATLTANRTINSLKLASGIDVAQAGFTLILESGGLLTTGGTGVTISGGSLTTGNANELIFHAYNTGGTTVSSTLTGTGGLTKTGTGTLTLSGTAANTLTGTTTINAGTVILNKTAGVNAIAGDIYVGDGRGTDILQINANEQIADTANVTLRGNTYGGGETKLVFGGTGTTGITETFADLTIEGTAILDFTGGSVCSPNYLFLDDLNIASGNQLLIRNWIEFTDFLLVDNSIDLDSVLPQIEFEGYGSYAQWTPYDSNWNQIRPVPEPATYGAIFVGTLSGLLGLRRWRKLRSK